MQFLKNYHTNANTSPPTFIERASLSVTTPLFVEMIATPKPPSTFGIFSTSAYTRSPGLEILFNPEIILSFLSAPYFNAIRIVLNAPSSGGYELNAIHIIFCTVKVLRAEF